MEITKSERIKVGAFMLICGLLILAFLGYVLNRYLSKEYDNYYTIFTDSVLGLYNEAQVKLNGITVGNVTGIQIDSSNLSQVIVTFRVEKGTPIMLGTRAGLTHGISLTGEKQVVLSGGRFDEPAVKIGGLVPAEASSFDQFANQAGGIVGKIDSLLHNFNTLFSSENSESISRSIKNIENATRNLSNLSQNLNKPVEDISSAAKSMKNVLDEIDEAKIAAKTSESIDVLRSKIDAIDTKKINDDITDAMASIQQLSKNLDQMVYKNQDQVGEALNELNEVLENLGEFSQKIKNNPSALIRNETSNRRR